MRNLRIETAIRRLDWRLEGRVPRRRRRQIRRELRANLAEAAADFGEVEALRRLGDLRELAREYLDAETGRLNLRVGAYAAVVALAGLQLAGILLLHGFQAGLEAAGGSGPAHFSLWPLSFETAPEDGVLFTATVAWPALVGFPLLAFLVWSRAWRLLAR